MVASATARSGLSDASCRSAAAAAIADTGFGATGVSFEHAANIVAVKTDTRLASMAFFTCGLLGTRGQRRAVGVASLASVGFLTGANQKARETRSRKLDVGSGSEVSADQVLGDGGVRVARLVRRGSSG